LFGGWSVHRAAVRQSVIFFSGQPLAELFRFAQYRVFPPAARFGGHFDFFFGVVGWFVGSSGGSSCSVTSFLVVHRVAVPLLLLFFWLVFVGFAVPPLAFLL